MKENTKKQEIFDLLARNLREAIEAEGLDFSRLQEIRLRSGMPLILLYGGRERILPSAKEEKRLVTEEELRETLDYISHYSLYAYEEEMRQGFLTVRGGHRIGLAGKVLLEKNRVKNIRYVSSLNIRVAHEVLGCAGEIMQYVLKDGAMCHTLIVSAPGCGKTTLIRDMIRQLSDGCAYADGHTVGVVDERSELGGCYHGVAQNRLGMRTDILDCCPKAEGMLMLVRSMSPDILAVDEIGTEEDVRAVEYAMQCGCRMLASAHAADMDEAASKPALGGLIAEKRFERYIVLKDRMRPGKIDAVYNAEKALLYQGSREGRKCSGC